MTATIAERVARGAALLDERKPDWVDRICLRDLNMECCCIIHQLYRGSFMGGLNTLGLTDDEALERGFWWDCDERLSDAQVDAEIEALDTAWRTLIEARRAGESR